MRRRAVTCLESLSSLSPLTTRRGITRRRKDTGIGRPNEGRVAKSLRNHQKIRLPLAHCAHMSRLRNTWEKNSWENGSSERRAVTCVESRAVTCVVRLLKLSVSPTQTDSTRRRKLSGTGLQRLMRNAVVQHLHRLRLVVILRRLREGDSYS